MSKDYSADMNQAYRDAKVDMQSLRAENARLRVLVDEYRDECVNQTFENARLREQVSILEAGRCTSCMEPINPLHQQCACSRAEFEMLYHQLNETDTLRTQAEALATALETVLYYAQTYTVARFERGKVADARATLRAYREATP